MSIVKSECVQEIDLIKGALPRVIKKIFQSETYIVSDEQFFNIVVKDPEKLNELLSNLLSSLQSFSDGLDSTLYSGFRGR